MKKIALGLLCSSIVAAPVLADEEAITETQEGPKNSYITGNFKANTERNNEYTLEVGHTFSTGTTVLVEVAGDFQNEVRTVTDTTFGIEQMVYARGGFWSAVGYHDLSLDGSTTPDGQGTGQRRPLFKLGYNFENGLFISNRTRFHYDTSKNDWKEVRYDNAIGYNLGDSWQFKLNTIYNQRDFADTGKFGQDGDRSSFNTEWRVTYFDVAGTGIAPYFELRDEDMGADASRNLAFTFGASYAF